MFQLTNFYLVRIKKPAGYFKKNGVYWFDAYNLSKVPENAVEYISANAIKPYTNQQTLLIVRTGGIGDLIALSVLQDVAPNTMVLTQKKHFKVLDMWQNPPKAVAFEEPLFYAANMNDLWDKLNDIGTLYGDEVIELGSPANWYDIFNAAVGYKGERRPQIKPYAGKVTPGCLIVTQSSSPIRTADPTNIVSAAKKFFHNVVLSHEQGWTTPQFLEAVQSFAYVISVDTCAIHIREGIGKPALGLYGAFTAYSRTDGYVFTKSIDVPTTCPLYPCFKHGTKPCTFSKGITAPCLDNAHEVVINHLDKIYERVGSNT